MSDSRIERKEQEKTKKKKKGKFKGFMKRVFLFCLIVSVLLLIFGFWLWKDLEPILNNIQNDAKEKVAQVNAQAFRSHAETIIYDKNQKEIERLAVHDYAYLPKEQITDWTKKAFVAIEDERFYEHHGVDPQAVLRAFVELVKNKGEIHQGGSTITQQLVKNTFLTQEQTYERKVKEMILAYEMEKKYSKDEILEFYINNINYANGNYGIETASLYYFSKPSKELTLAETAFLVAIPNNPSLYDPAQHKDNTMKRQSRILGKMKELGFITASDYDKAKQEVVTLHIQPKEQHKETYAINYAIADATRALMKKQGFEFQYRFESNEKRKQYEKSYQELFQQINRQIRNGGYKIYTRLDTNKQAILQKSVDNGLKGFTKKNKDTGRYNTQGAGVIIDNETGSVEAIVGGRSQEGIEDWFNRGYLAYRQPGSSIKPLVAYTQAFEKGMLPSTTINDKEDPSDKYYPQNAQRRHYGYVSLRYATELSLNTIPYQLVKQFTPQASLEYLQKMEFSQIVKEDEQASIAVGGFTYGVTPLEMAGGFATLARNGEYIRPYTVEKISDATDQVLYENAHKKVQVYDSGSAYIMTDVLQGVLRERYASGYGLAIPNMPTAGKTGTTNDSKDGWFCGYTPYYTATVWVGNDNPSAINGLYGASYPGHIWRDAMKQIHEGLKTKEFSVPNTVQELYVSPRSGDVLEHPYRNWKKQWVPSIYLQTHDWANQDAEDKWEEQQKALETPSKKQEETPATTETVPIEQDNGSTPITEDVEGTPPVDTTEPADTTELPDEANIVTTP